MKLLTVATDLNREGLINLINSAKRFGWDIEVIVTEWRGFGTKLIETYNYLKKNPDVTEFIFVDAYDVLVLSTPEEFKEKIVDKDKMLISVEKNCWPDSSLSILYPLTFGNWKYINSGSYYSPSRLFIDIVEDNPPLYTDDDQLWFTNQFLDNPENKLLNYSCDIFQAYSFIADDDFEYIDNRVFNKKTLVNPIFLHGNGKTDMTKVLELL